MLFAFVKSFGSATDGAQDRTTLSLRSGPGAPMFEAGPQTRIRRTPVRSIATLTWEGGPREIFGLVLNVSPGGCLIKTEATIKPGTPVDMTVIVVGGEERTKMDVKGLVKHETTAEGRKAYGIEFVAAERADRESLQWLYAQASNFG